MNSTFFFAQDTIVGTRSDSTTSLKKFSTVEVEDIFMAMERREKERDSVSRVKAYRAYLQSIEKKEPEGFDTSAVPYNFAKDTFLPGQNPLNNFKESFYSSKDTAKPLYRETSDETSFQTLAEVSPIRKSLSEHSHNLRPDWLMGIIIVSLVLLAWLKLFYNKFLDQTIQSVANYQLSNKLLRDQNMFSRRVAFFLNINFILTGAAFIYLMLGFFRIRFFHVNDFMSYLVYAGILTGFLLLRLIVTHLVGHVFNKHNEFREYLHQLLLIHKNLGIYLLILVFGISYIRDDLRIYLVYISVLIGIAALILRVGKGLKIIFNNKDVSMFYLILYLCTLEILPLLIFYRFFSSSVQAG